MAECTGLENRRGVKLTGGSNPPPLRFCRRRFSQQFCRHNEFGDDVAGDCRSSDWLRPVSACRTESQSESEFRVTIGVTIFGPSIPVARIWLRVCGQFTPQFHDAVVIESLMQHLGSVRRFGREGVVELCENPADPREFVENSVFTR